jgi:hypothetical protein
MQEDAMIPPLDRLETVHLNHQGMVALIVEKTETDRCDDENCTLPHRTYPVSHTYVMEPSREVFLALAEHFARLAERDVTPPRKVIAVSAAGEGTTGLSYQPLIYADEAHLPPADRTPVAPLHAHNVTDRYGDALGFLVKMGDGQDYGRDSDEEVAHRGAAELGGTVWAWGDADDGRVSRGGWHMIVRCDCRA